MPSPKDITGDLYRLHKNPKKPASPSPRDQDRQERRVQKAYEAASAPERRLRFEPLTLFAWSLTAAFTLSQFAVIYWLGR